MTMELTGINASPGVASGSAYLLSPRQLPEPTVYPSPPGLETERLSQAITAAVVQLEDIQRSLSSSAGDSAAHIFRSQQTILEDPALVGEVTAVIHQEHICAEGALRRVVDQYRLLFLQLQEDAYNRERVADLDDVYQRLLRNLLGVKEATLLTIPAQSIVVAVDLLPSDTALVDPSLLKGLVLEGGAATSHVAILARNLGIPMVVQAAGALEKISPGSEVVLDALDSERATVVVHPNAEQLRRCRSRVDLMTRRREVLARYAGAEAVTRDGHRLSLSANVGATGDLAPARRDGATRVGLYRSEFLFLRAATPPTEDEQYQAYRTAAELFPQGGAVIRTLDAGGDKPVQGLSLTREANPFLGARGLRLSLTHPEFFRAQLRAILRAAVHGPLQIMFPMVGGVPDLEAALAILDEVREELDTGGVVYNRDVTVGAMIEVPSAALVAEALARRVSFLSIGTNDLTQYLTATDRLNGAVQEYYRVYDPSVFRTIRMVVDAGHRVGCQVGVCGELGGNPLAIPALVGMRVDELSMGASSLATAAWLVREGSYSDMQELSAAVLQQEDHRVIRRLLEEYHEEQIRRSGL